MVRVDKPMIRVLDRNKPYVIAVGKRLRHTERDDLVLRAVQNQDILRKAPIIPLRDVRVL